MYVNGLEVGSTVLPAETGTCKSKINYKDGTRCNKPSTNKEARLCELHDFLYRCSFHCANRSHSSQPSSSLYSDSFIRLSLSMQNKAMVFWCFTSCYCSYCGEYSRSETVCNGSHTDNPDDHLGITIQGTGACQKCAALQRQREELLEKIAALQEQKASIEKQLHWII